MKHKKCNVEKISAYIDKELESSKAGWLEQHLSECAMCTRVFNMMRSGKNLIKRRFTRAKAPATLEERIVASVREEAGYSPGRSEPVPFIKRLFAPHPAWAAVSLIFLVVAGVIHLRTIGIISQSGEVPTTIGAYVDDINHDAFLLERLPKRPFDVVCTNPDEAEPLISRLAGFHVEIPHLDDVGYHLQGGELWHTVSRISAMIVYDDNKGARICLFEIKKDGIGMTGARSVDVDGQKFYIDEGYGYCGICWVQGETAYGLVGKQTADELLVIADNAADELALLQ